jgi:hypothetical protein
METRIVAGDVIEFESNGEATTALVLLVSTESAILDRCDGTTPVVIPLEDLHGVRVFEPYGLAA